MRVFQVGAGHCPHPIRASSEGQRAGCRFSKAVEATGACLRVVPGTDAHTKGTTGLTRLKMRSKVGGVQSPTGQFSMTRTFVRSRATWGQAVVFEGN